MAYDQHLLWTTKGQRRAAAKDSFDPYSLHDCYHLAAVPGGPQGKPQRRIKSAAPSIGDNDRNSFVRSLIQSHKSVRNPSPTPATSRPLSSKSGRSSISSRSMQKTNLSAGSSPTALFLTSHITRCKSAPARPSNYHYQQPESRKTGKSGKESATSARRTAPKRAWQNRTSSAKSQHSLLSREEVDRRHKERCKSAPLPYDFSSIEVVCSVPEHSSDIQRLKAFTRPLNCMPNVVQNVLSHNGLRHCCSAYQPRPNSVCSSRQQFWPVPRPAVFHRGDVPKYLHFVKPAGFWIKGEEVRTSVGNEMLSDTYPEVLLEGGDDDDDDDEEIVLYQEQFIIPPTPSASSMSDRDECDTLHLEVEDLQSELDMDASTVKDLADVYGSVKHADGKDEECNNVNDYASADATPEKVQEECEHEDQTSELTVVGQGIEVIITKVEQSASGSASHPEDVKQESEALFSSDGQENELPARVPKIPQWATQEEVRLENKEPLGDRDFSENTVEQSVKGPLEDVELSDQRPLEEDIVPELDHEIRDPVVPVTEVEEELPKEVSVNNQSKVEEVKPQVNQVKFADSFILTSYKPQSKKEKKEQPVRPVSILKPTLAKPEEKVSVPVPQKKAAFIVERELPGDLSKVRKPLVKAVNDETGKNPEVNKEEEPKTKVQYEEEREEEPPKVEPTVLPKPEYVRAPGAYRMYNPKDLLDYHVEQKREVRHVKKSLSSTTMPPFKPSAESTEVMATVLGEHKRRRESMKPWLQGRLALSKQTSRFELPMDVKLLEAMTPMEYLTKFCIISTRRKALYKHIFQKVDKDRDNVITVKEMDRGLREIHVDCITTDQVNKLIEMVDGNEKSTFNLVQFSAIAAFSERLLFSEIQITEKNSVYSSKEVIEEADFCGLKSKLSGFTVNPSVRKILEVL